jgi:NitT/TauT family transport system substrate-binding protein
MERGHLLIGLAVAALIVIGPSQGTAQEKVRIGLPTKGYTLNAPPHLAVELGYYKESGVVAEVTEYRGGGAAMEALAAGAADLILVGPATIALAVKKGVKAKVVAAARAEATGWHIMVLQNSPIRSLKDLADKKIGISVKGSSRTHTPSGPQPRAA